MKREMNNMENKEEIKEAVTLYFQELKKYLLSMQVKDTTEKRDS